MALIARVLGIGEEANVTLEARRIRPHRSRKALFADVRLPNDASETESEEYRSNGDANRDAKDAREERLHGP